MTTDHDISDPDESPREQRRDSFRVDLLHSADVCMRGGEPLHVDITDLSASGCSFVLRVDVAVDDTGSVTLALGDGTSVSTQIAVRAVRADDGLNLVGAQFVGLSPVDTERIIKAVFVQQRHQLRRIRTGRDSTDSPAAPDRA